MPRPVYVTGHKNPDTDSIVSAIAYAEYLRQKGTSAKACRLGSVPEDTEYLLERFGFDYPERIYTAKCSVSDIDIDPSAKVSKDLRMKEALDKVNSLRNRGLSVTDAEGRLQGIVTQDCLTFMWTKTDEELVDIISSIKLDDAAEILEGNIVLRGEAPLSGQIHLFPGLNSDVTKGSIVLLRNEDDKLLHALACEAAMIIVVTSSQISDDVLYSARAVSASIITTKLSPLAVTRLIHQAPTVEQVMVPADKVICFSVDDTLEEVGKITAQSRYRAYPVIDREGKVAGSLSRYHLLTAEKKKFVLVDHNELKQTVDDIEEGEIIEIVDHHRIGGIETDSVINITVASVGATATLISERFFDSNAEMTPELAGLLLGAITADTMNFRSPTTTARDLRQKDNLERISGVTAEELSNGMISVSPSILSKRYIEIVYDDFKEFMINGFKVGLSQNTCKTRDEYEALKNDLASYMEDACKSGGYDLMISMLTNPNGSGSYLIGAGPRKQIAEDLFPLKDGFAEDLVSRKKQLLPSVISALS